MWSQEWFLGSSISRSAFPPAVCPTGVARAEAKVQTTTKKDDRIFTNGTVSLVFEDTMKITTRRISPSDTPPKSFYIDKVPQCGVNFRTATVKDATHEVAWYCGVLISDLPFTKSYLSCRRKIAPAKRPYVSLHLRPLRIDIER